MTFNRSPFGDDQPAGSGQVLTQLGFEVLALLHLAGIQRVLQFDDEASAVWNGIRRCYHNRLTNCGTWRRGCLRNCLPVLWSSLAIRRTGLQNRAMVVLAAILLSNCTQNKGQ